MFAYSKKLPPVSQSILTRYIPRATPRDSLKHLPGGLGFDFWKLPEGREFDKGRDFVAMLNAI